jgi:hypothetical protein
MAPANPFAFLHGLFWRKCSFFLEKGEQLFSVTGRTLSLVTAANLGSDCLVVPVCAWLVFDLAEATEEMSLVQMGFFKGFFFS